MVKENVNQILFQDAKITCEQLPNESVQMFYMDPPFGTGKQQTHRGNAYADPAGSTLYFLSQIIENCHRSLKSTGVICIHVDFRSSHAVKLFLDSKLGSHNFLNEIIWSYNFGGRSKDRWPRKHDNIFVYTKNMNEHVFYSNQTDRIPYKAPELQKLGRSKEAAECRIKMGQIPTDVWTDIPIIGTASYERVGYPTQKPVKLMERFIKAFTLEGDLVVDPCAGSGTIGCACKNLNRNFILSDQNLQAIQIMKSRLENEKHVVVE